MKKIKYFLTISVLTCLLATSCNDVLDNAPDGKIKLKEVFLDPDKVSAFLNSCYNNIPVKNLSYHFFEALVVAMSDDAYSSSDLEGQNLQHLYNGNNSATWHSIRDNADTHGGSLSNYWARYYGQIRLCNQFLENIDEARVRSEDDRSRMKAEAHLLRAFFYSEIVKWYGAAPIVRTVLPLDETFTGIKRDSPYDVIKFIESDCDAALTSSALPWRITTNDEAPRLTKAFAVALKSRMLLFAASPLFNGGGDYWEEAYQANKQAVTLLKENGYALYRTVANAGRYGNNPWSAYHELVTTKMEYSSNPTDKETIWQHREGASFSWHVNYIGMGPNMYKCGACPTQELVDAYETNDGSSILNLANPYSDEKHLNPNFNSANTLYDPTNPYANRDPRFYATVVYNGAEVELNGIQTRIDIYTGSSYEIMFDVSGKHTRTGYYHKKMVVPGTGGSIGDNNAPWKFFRLAEILLNYAEAAAQADHPADAYAAVNEVRDRVGMPALPNGLSKAELLLRIQNERRVELAFEETRYFDLRRWSTPTGNLSSTSKWFTAMKISKTGDNTFSYDRRSVRDAQRYGFENKDLLLPLKLDEASKMEFLTGVNWQNPGW